MISSLPIDPAQQTLRIINQDFQSFFKILCLKQSGKYSQQVKLPKYKNKNSYFNLIINSVKLGMEDVLYKNDEPVYAAEGIKYMAENNEVETGTEPYFALDFLNSLYSYLENELS